MSSDDPVITELARANPVSRTATPAAHERAEADRVLDRVLSATPRSPRHWPILAPVLSVLVVGGVVAAALGVGGSSHSGAPARGGLQLVLQAEPTPQVPVITPTVMSREVQIVRERLDTVLSSVRVGRSGADRVVITAANAAGGTRARIARLVSERAQLYFYDWEANALTASGRTVKTQLRSQEPTALSISQGSGALAPGDAGAGSMTLYNAVSLATKQPLQASPDNGRRGPLYYMFGAPGSTACATAARAQGKAPMPGVHCLLSGPDDNVQDLIAGLPAGVSASDGQTRVVKQGTVILQAAPATFAHPVSVSDPSAQFFVLKDHVSLFANGITNPRQSTDQTGAPNVTFGLTPKGKKEFQNLTAAIARRGDLLSGLGQSFNQHFAVALDSQLITLPSIDFKAYPDGITSNRADITAGFSTESAKDLATALRFGPLPLQLRLVR